MKGGKYNKPSILKEKKMFEKAKSKVRKKKKKDSHKMQFGVIPGDYFLWGFPSVRDTIGVFKATVTGRNQGGASARNIFDVSYIKSWHTSGYSNYKHSIFHHVPES